MLTISSIVLVWTNVIAGNGIRAAFTFLVLIDHGWRTHCILLLTSLSSGVCVAALLKACKIVVNLSLLYLGVNLWKTNWIFDGRLVHMRLVGASLFVNVDVHVVWDSGESCHSLLGTWTTSCNNSGNTTSNWTISVIVLSNGTCIHIGTSRHTWKHGVTLFTDSSLTKVVNSVAMRWRILVVILLILLVSGLDNANIICTWSRGLTLAKRWWVIAEGTGFVVLVCPVIWLGADSSNGTVAEVVALVIILFGFHLHDNVISTRWYSFGGVLASSSSCLWMVWLVGHVNAFWVIVVVMASWSRMTSLWTLARCCGIIIFGGPLHGVVVHALVDSIQIDLVVVALRGILVALLILIKRLGHQVTRHEVVHHTKLCTSSLLLCRTNWCVSSQGAITGWIRSVWNRWVSNVICLAVRQILIDYHLVLFVIFAAQGSRFVIHVLNWVVRLIESFLLTSGSTLDNFVVSKPTSGSRLVSVSTHGACNSRISWAFDTFEALFSIPYDLFLFGSCSQTVEEWVHQSLFSRKSVFWIHHKQTLHQF